MFKLKFPFAVVLLTALVTFAACNKDDDEPPIPPEKPGICDDDNYVIEFADVNLKNALCQILQKDVITCGDAKQVTNLDLEGMSISKLEGIEYFVNLDSLNLSLNPISDYTLADSLNLSNLVKDYPDTHIVNFNDATLEASLRTALNRTEGVSVEETEPLTYGILKSLEKIELYDNMRMQLYHSGDLEGLQYCVNAKRLSIALFNYGEEHLANRIQDFTPIGALAKIEDLVLRNMDLSTVDLLPLGRLQKTEGLQLVSCALSNPETGDEVDFSPLSNLTSVKLLSMMNTVNSHIDKSAFAAFTELETIIINNGAAYNGEEVIEMDLSFLSGASKLSQCNFQMAGIKNLSPLSGCNELKTVYLGGNSLDASSFSAFKSKPKLEVLGLEGCDIDNAGFANLMDGANLPSLYKLGLSGNYELTDLSPIKLAKLDMFTTKTPTKEQGKSMISLTNIPLSDLKPLSNLFTLQRLEIEKTAVVSFEGLENIKLTDLIATYIDVSDLEPLSNITSMENLWLSYTKITSLSDLYLMANLKTLQINSTEVSVAERDAFAEKVPDCEIICYGCPE